MRRKRALPGRIVAGLCVSMALIALPIPSASLRAQPPAATKPGVALARPVQDQTPPDPGPFVPQPGSTAGTGAVATPIGPQTGVLTSPSTIPASTTEVISADPEAWAKQNAEKMVNEADANIVALTGEAKQLRARLLKVEAGLARWQRIKAALDGNVVYPNEQWITDRGFSSDQSVFGLDVVPPRVHDSRDDAVRRGWYPSAQGVVKMYPPSLPKRNP